MPKYEQSPSPSPRNLEIILAEFDALSDIPEAAKILLKDSIQLHYASIRETGKANSDLIKECLAMVRLLRAEGHNQTADLFSTAGAEVDALATREWQQTLPNKKPSTV